MRTCTEYWTGRKTQIKKTHKKSRFCGFSVRPRNSHSADIMDYNMTHQLATSLYEASQAWYSSVLACFDSSFV